MKNTTNQVKFTISLAIVFTAIVFNANQASGQFYEEYIVQTHMPVITSYEIVVQEEAAPSYDPYDLVALESIETETAAPAETAPAKTSPTSVDVVQSSTAVQTPATNPIADPIPASNVIPENYIPFVQPQAMPVQMEMPMPIQMPIGGNMPMICTGGT